MLAIPLNVRDNAQFTQKVALKFIQNLTLTQNSVPDGNSQFTPTQFILVIFQNKMKKKSEERDERN
jgi:hypothetical protein